MGEFDKIWTPVSCFGFAALCYWLSWDVVAGLLLLLGLVMTAGVVLLTARDKYRESSAAKAEHERQRRLMQQARNQAVQDLVEKALRSLEYMPVHLADAERHLDQAEKDFRDRVFSPFWDAVEAATTSLAQFSQSVELITSGCIEYGQLVQGYEGTRLQFPIRSDSILPIGVATTTSERLGRVVRLAQQDFQFATIFEQHKTNRILIQGFNSLAEAIALMTTRLEEAIRSLEAAVNRMNREVGSAVRSVGAGIAAAESARALRENKALTELRRISRRL